MRHVLFIHSAGTQDAREGSGPLVAALKDALAADIRVTAPIMPEPEDPNGEAWDFTLREYLRTMPAPFVLVGHSLGGSSILRYLASHDRPKGLEGVVSIATPFWGNEDWEAQYRLPAGFERRLSRVPIALFHSRDDDVIPFSHAERYAAALPHVRLHAVDGHGHLFDDGNVSDIVAEIRRMFDE